MKKHLLLLIILFTGLFGRHCSIHGQQQVGDASSRNEVTPEGAWCWFADPRALHHENLEKNIEMTYIGYIDTHGNIKATQINHRTDITEEILIRSWFQPDDHDNPTFLVLPDDRVMVFYSRHTDEPCFYYRITRRPADLTTLGEEKIIKTRNNTTYPSPFFLKDDPKHIYLCWRGIGWHPTIGRLLLPDANGDTNFDWGPYQMVQSTGARPYAKYATNGQDKIFMTYTTGHPDNEQPNHVYFNCIDIHSLKLTDVKGRVLSTIQDGPHPVNKSPEYTRIYPDAVVTNTNFRNWVWELTTDSTGHPIIALAQISPDKTEHNYYYTRWTGEQWQPTFLTHGGSHFHQTPDTERCYSGGMTIDKRNPSRVVCSVPMEGKYGRVYELMEYNVDITGKTTAGKALTRDSQKNNVRPYFIQSTSANTKPCLAWMQGDYYDWIVSKKRPLGYCTSIQTYPVTPERENKKLAVHRDRKKRFNGTMSLKAGGAFTIVVLIPAPTGTLVQSDAFTYALDAATMKPYVIANGSIYCSTNVLGTSDGWKQAERSTDGVWITPSPLDTLRLALTYEDGVLRTYVNGLLDQRIEIPSLKLKNVIFSTSENKAVHHAVYNRRLTQEEIKRSFLRFPYAEERNSASLRQE